MATPLRPRHITLLTALSISILVSYNTTKRAARRARYMQDTYTSLKQGLSDGEVTYLKDSIRILFPRNLMFDFGKSTVRTEQMPTLARFAGILKQYKRTHILIIGRTDSVGGDNTDNIRLSERRADSATAVMHYYGLRDKRMEHWGVGAKDPLATNATEEGRQRNRSVEFIVLMDMK